MKALIIDKYGSPQDAHLGEVEPPKVKDGYLLVRMRAAAVNPFDDKIITGMVKDFFPVQFPYVPGMDGAGEVVEVGNDVENWRKGDAVFGMFNGGAFSEFATIAAKEKRLARKPEGLDFAYAAAIPEAGLTALTLLRAANVQSGNQVFIIGATGGIGLFAVQLAKAQGAHVIATGKPSDVEYLRSLGVDDVIDYTSGDPIAQVRAQYPNGVDSVIDVINSGDRILPSASVIRSGGTLASSLYGPEQSSYPQGVTVQYIQMHAQPDDLDDLGQRAARGELRVEVQTYPFDQARQALVDLLDPAKHTRGKLVVTIP